VGGQLAADRVVALERVAALERIDGDQVEQHPAALDVREELVPESGPLCRPRDQARDVGEHELALAVVDRAEHRLDGRERIVRDLRRGPRQSPEERGLAGVREPDQPAVGEQLQPQLDPSRLTRESALGKARGLPGRGREALVAVPAGAAVGDHHPLAGGGEVEALAAQPLHLGAGRDEDDLVLAARAVALLSLAVPAAPRPVMGGEALGGEIAPRRVADNDDIAAAAAVATIGTPARHVRLAAHAHRSVAPRAAFDVDSGRVVQHRLNRRRVRDTRDAGEDMLGPARIRAAGTLEPREPGRSPV
jgi:hypothetical protein